jgi:hypothetical protein
MTIYVWRKELHRKRHAWHRLIPADKPEWYSLCAIATIYPNFPGYRVQYKWNSTGNKPEGWAVFSTIPQAKRWAEAQLIKFWEPSTLTSNKQEN